MSNPLTIVPNSPEWVALRKRALTDLYWFADVVLGYGDKVPMTPHTHYAMCRFAERRTGIPQLDDAHYRMVSVPRGVGKTTLITRARSIQLALAHDNVAILIANERQENANAFLAEIKSHFEGNEFLRALFPERMPGDFLRDWSAERAMLPRSQQRVEPTFMTIGVGGTITGMHPDVIICMPPQQTIYTSRGLTKAGDLAVGQRVLSHDGKFHSVKRVVERPFKGQLVGIRTRYAPESCWFTPEHPILVWRLGPDGLPAIRFVPAKDVRYGDVCVVPRLAPHKGNSRLGGRGQTGANRLLRDERTWRMLGFWLAEGCAGPYTRFSFGPTEQRYVDEVVAYAADVLGVAAFVDKVEHGIQVRFSHADFKHLTSLCGTHAANKFVPAFVLQATHEKIGALLSGYYDGDGCHINGWQQATSVSLSLLTGIALLEMRRGNGASIAHAAPPGEVEIRGKVARRKGSFSLIVHPAPTGSKPRQSWCDRAFFYVPVNEVYRKNYDGFVYNVEVEDTHTMTSLWMAHHNCDDVISREAMENARAGSWQIMERTNRWINQLRPLLNLNCPFYEIFVVGTRWWQGDSYEHIERSFGYGETEQKFLLKTKLTDGSTQVLPATRRGDLACFRRSIIEDGACIFPEKYSLDDLAKIKVADPELYSANYENNPTSQLIAVFKIAWLRYYDYDTPRQVHFTDRDGKDRYVLTDGLDCILSVDPAFAEGGEGRSRAALVLTGSTDDGHRLLLVADAKKGGAEVLTQDIVALCTTWKPRKLLIERAGQQAAFILYVRQALAKAGIFTPIEEVTPGGKKKDVRIATLGPYFQRGTIYVKRDQLDFLHEFETFDRGEWKDLLDALAYQPPFWRNPTSTTTDGTPREEQRVRDERERLYRRMGTRPVGAGPKVARDSRIREDGTKRW